MLDKVREWFGLAPIEYQATHGHDHSAEGGHGHTHGVIDPTIATTERGIWAIKWSFVILTITAALQIVVVLASGRRRAPRGHHSQRGRRDDRHPLVDCL